MCFALGSLAWYIVSMEEWQNNSFTPVIEENGGLIKVNSVGGEEKVGFDDYLEFFLRMFLVFVVIVGFVGVSYFFVSRAISARILTNKRNILYVTPYKMLVLEGFGLVSEPEVKLAVKTKKGFETVKFLLDSGAVVSSLPREMATKMGYNLAFLPRTVFTGFGNKSSFAYRADMIVRVGKREVNLPVVFTQMSGTQPLIGRKGFFDNFAIIFDAKNKQILIKEK